MDLLFLVFLEFLCLLLMKVAWENEITGWDISTIDGTIFRIDNTDTDTVSDWTVSNSLGNPGVGSYTIVEQSDFTPPEVSIDNLTNGSIISGIFRISVSATDESGIAEFEISIDDQLKSSTNIYNWNTLEEINDSHSVRARVRDTAGNWGQVLINLEIDNSDYIPLEFDQVKFMTYNVEVSGINSDWIDVIKEENPDIVVFVETGDWDNNNDALFQQYLSEFNMYFSGENQFFGNTGQNIPYATSGEAIMSRFPIESTTQIPVVTLDNGTNFDPSHDFMSWTIDIDGEEIYVIGSHLKCCGGADNEEKREHAQEGIINYMDSLGDVPIIYAGDLNSFSPYDTGSLAPEGDLSDGPLTMMLNPQDPTYGQYASNTHTFIDVYRELNPESKGYTYGHQDSQYESRIDFIIANQFFFDKLVSSTTGDTVTANSGSDHYTVDVIIDFVGSGTESSNSQTSSIPTLGDSESSDEVEGSGFSLILNFTSMVILIIVVRFVRNFQKLENPKMK